MSRKQWRVHVPPTLVKSIGEIGQGLGRVAEAMQQQHRLAGAGSLSHDGLRAFDDAARSDREAHPHTSRDPPGSCRAPHRDDRDDEYERDNGGSHYESDRCERSVIAGNSNAPLRNAAAARYPSSGAKTALAD